MAGPAGYHLSSSGGDVGSGFSGGSTAAGGVTSPTLGSGASPLASTTSSALTHQHDTELALAELELLGQNQRKLGSLTNRMTAILSGFDRRLIKLESTMLPIHRSTQTLLRIQENVDEVLDSLDKTLGHYDVVQDEEPLIMQGASVRDPGPYLETIERVQRGLDYLSKSDLKSQQKVMNRMHDLIETGSRSVCSVIKDWVQAESQDFIDPADYLPRGIALPVLSEATREHIVPLLSFLKTLPIHPRTHHAPFSSALAAYAEIRSTYVEACLAPSNKRVLAYAQERVGVNAGAAGRAGMAAAWGDDDDDDIGYARGNAGLADWMSSTLDMAENEYGMLSSLLSSLDPPSSTSTIQSTFARLLRAPLRDYSHTIQALHHEVRRHMSLSTSHTFFCFDIVAALSIAAPKWELIIVNGCAGHSGGGSEEKAVNPNALPEALQTLRGTAMQVFPTFIQTVNAMPQQREGEVPSTTINEITYSTLNFMRRLCEYHEVVAPLLTTLGAGNWMMGQGGAPVLSLGLDSEGGESILSQYLCDVLATCLDALEARSRAIRQPSTASIFLLNNIGHIQREIVSNREGSSSGSTSSHHLSVYLGSIGQELPGGAMRQATKAYLDVWSPVAGALMDDNISAALGSSMANISSVPSSRSASSKITAMGSSNEKNAVKDRFAKFYDSLDDLERLHRAYPIAREDPQLRERLRSDVVRLVCPLYARFVAKHRAGDFSKNPQKHIRMTEQEVEDRISSLFK